jgi:hypothetical protein
MGIPVSPPGVRRIAGLLASSPALLDEAQQAVSETIGFVTAASAAEPWTASRYYEPEMGVEIWRRYLILDGLMPPDELVALKLATNALELRWCSLEHRSVNIDPGYVDLNRLVLASTKDAAHRIYVGHGIYAEVTLRYVDGTFVPLPYTYPDYAMPSTRAFFTRARAGYRSELAAMRHGPDHRAR